MGAGGDHAVIESHGAVGPECLWRVQQPGHKPLPQGLPALGATVLWAPSDTIVGTTLPGS